MALATPLPSGLERAASAVDTTTNNLKRKRTDARRSVSDFGAPVSPQSTPEANPAKRPKVHIDLSANKYHDAPPPNDDMPYLLVREEVRRALLRDGRNIEGGNDRKAALSSLFTMEVGDEYAPSEALMLKHVDALASMANLLVQNPSVVSAVMNVQWIGRGEDFVLSYTRLLGNLAATGGSFQTAVLQALIQRFTQTRSSAGRLPGYAIVSRSQLLSRLHQAIKHVLQMAPSSITTFQTLLRSSFPYSTDSLRTHTDYVSNLLRIIAYESSLNGEILGLIIDKLMKIDAQVLGDVEEVEEDLGINLMEDVLTSLGKSAGRTQEEEHSDSESDEESDWGEDEDPTVARLEQIKTSIIKMDAILEMLFEYFDPAFEKRGSSDADAAFEQLSSIFSQTILHTRNSRHTQFLLFHFAQTDPRLLERFTVSLISYTLNRNRSPMFRENAVMYLASLISRGSRASQHTIDEAIDVLLHELERYRLLYEPKCRDGPDLARWPAYYFIAQALLYIFCFRWRNLLVDGDDLDDQDIMSAADLAWRPGLREILTRNITSKLNPLKVCTPPIVQQFARISHYLRFMYVYNTIEWNRRRPFLASRVTDALGGRSRTSGQYQLEAWFPFDPYHLPRSKRWLEGDYITYQDPPGLLNEGEEDADDDTDQSGLLNEQHDGAEEPFDNDDDDDDSDSEHV